VEHTVATFYTRVQRTHVASCCSTMTMNKLRSTNL